MPVGRGVCVCVLVMSAPKPNRFKLIPIHCQRNAAKKRNWFDKREAESGLVRPVPPVCCTMRESRLINRYTNIDISFYRWNSNSYCSLENGCPYEDMFQGTHACIPYKLFPVLFKVDLIMYYYH